MTYGWAILVVLIAIGALAYFGVLNPARFLPNSCTLFPGLACTEFKVTADADGIAPWTGQIDLIVRNGIGDGIVLSGATLTAGACAAPTTDFAVAGTFVAVPGTLGDGAAGTIRFGTCNPGAKASRFKADIGLTYALSASGSLTHTRTGAMVAQVE